jgi:preprotein translocase subunit SecA
MEAEIVAQAGRESAITIATNMAGRGTDILLGGNPEMLAKKETRSTEGPDYERALEKYTKICEEEKQHVIDAGGLFILGTERHESRRIDNQLRGRSGRQGDPGCSQFYLSMEDDLMRLFGSAKIVGLMETLGWEEGEPIEHSMVSRSIESAQRKVESYHFDIRKHVLKYDDVMNEQRTIIYSQRRRALEQESVHDDILAMIDSVLERMVGHCIDNVDPDDIDYDSLAEQVKKIFPIEAEGGKIVRGQSKGLPGQLCTYQKRELFDELKRRVLAKLDEKIKEIGLNDFYQMEKFLLLQIVDAKWKDHLHNMDTLQDGIHLRSWGQRDPLVEYKIEGFDMFQDMIETIREDILYYIFRVRYSHAEEHEAQERHEEEMQYNRSSDETPQAPAKSSSEPSRNDPCPCGSGKKYKNCCGAYK